MKLTKIILFLSKINFIKVRSDFIRLDQLLQDLKLDFEAIEVTVTKYFRDDKN